VTLLVLGPTRLGKMNDNCNILVLKYIGYVEPSIVVMMTSKNMAKIGFGIGITLYLRNPRWFFIVFLLIPLVLCGWFYRFKITL
jgi:hypothetical protein